MPRGYTSCSNATLRVPARARVLLIVLEVSRNRLANLIRGVHASSLSSNCTLPRDKVSSTDVTRSQPFSVATHLKADTLHEETLQCVLIKKVCIRCFKLINLKKWTLEAEILVQELVTDNEITTSKVIIAFISTSNKLKSICNII